ncbi:sugar-binding protein [Bacillus sp. PS06]|uniref:sugar-binding protein n=1 Tax=Bacillus sp. PS06 TaxID=2764176 RepID=UPI001783F27A|nr:sugar-binding protein [Bacillus sp. PS06]MBD8070655.1 sugar-binding protein [Bacillus sp. PS06]
MTRKSLIYVVLIAASIGALFFFFYSSFKVQKIEWQINEYSSEAANEPKSHFVLIGEEMDNDYWQLVGQGAKKAEAVNDVYVEYKGPRRANPDEQLKLLDMAIKSKVDGIIVQAINDEKFRPMINKAVAEGIPVVTIDTDSPQSQRSTYIGTDNYLAGQMAGQALIEDTNGHAKIGIITGSFSSAHHQLRVEGFLDTVETVAGMEVVAIEESNITRVGAEEKAYRILTNHEEVTALFGTSALDGIGIAATVQSLNKQDDMYVVAFDALSETLQLLETGKIQTIIAQTPFEMGYQSVERMLDILEGNSFQSVYHTDTKAIRKENIAEIKVTDHVEN